MASLGAPAEAQPGWGCIHGGRASSSHKALSVLEDKTLAAVIIQYTVLIKERFLLTITSAV